jgi:hypothetical protein
MSEEPAAESYRARVFYHWRKPGEKERHGFSMGMVTVQEQTKEALIAALKVQHEKLREFDLFIDKLEWR